ncbi:hypothetical protein KKC60_05555, partial [Patescibacteria group bacterium]|nr:hypothetical protein [Patescibacteria group bacterium]
MKIGIDARQMLDPADEKGGGVERYTFSLVTRLINNSDNKFVLFLKSGYQSLHLLRKNNTKIVFVKESRLPVLGNHLLFANILK